MQYRKCRSYDLDQQPGRNSVDGRYPDDVAALEFVDEGHNGLFVAIGGVHSARGSKHGLIQAIILVFAQIPAHSMCANAIESEW